MKKFNQLYQLILQSLQEKIQNKHIILIPLNSKSISKSFGYRLNTYSDMYDEVILILSNITKQKKQNQSLSMTNLQKVIKIFSRYKLDQSKKVQAIISEIQNNENITFSELQKKIKQINSKVQSEAFKNQLDKIILDIRTNIFKNVQDVDTITAKRQQLDKLIKQYNLKNINVELSKRQSPVDDIISFINDKCKNCQITINMKGSKKLQKYLNKDNQNHLHEDMKI